MSALPAGWADGAAALAPAALTAGLAAAGLAATLQAAVLAWRLAPPPGPVPPTPRVDAIRLARRLGPATAGLVLVLAPVDALLAGAVLARADLLHWRLPLLALLLAALQARPWRGVDAHAPGEQAPGIAAHAAMLPLLRALAAVAALLASGTIAAALPASPPLAAALPATALGALAAAPVLALGPAALLALQARLVLLDVPAPLRGPPALLLAVAMLALALGLAGGLASG